MFGKMQVFGLLLSVLVIHIDASAIPMWEYLSKQEKMSFLYSVFATQVEHFCEDNVLENCNRVLLRYGLNKLKSLPEEYLDSMDPYQRGANQLIWDSMMAGHPLAAKYPHLNQNHPSSTPKPNSYEDEPYTDLDLGSHGSASAKIDNVAVVPAPKHILAQYNYNQPLNVASYLNAIQTPVKKGAYTKFLEQYTSSTTTTTTTTTERNGDDEVDPMDEGMYQDAPLTGPMVVRVYPDGTPVKDTEPLPQDEDLRQYKMSQVKIPNF